MNINHVRNNQNGSAIIGFLLAVLVMAVIFGGFYFWGTGNPNDPNGNSNDPNTLIDTLNNAKSDIADINKQTADRNVEAPSLGDSEQDASDNTENNTKEQDKEVEDKQDTIVPHPYEGGGQEGVISTGNEMIKIFNIEKDQTITSPVKIEGEGKAFENTLIVELRDENHKAKVKEFVTTKSPDIGIVGPFAITLHFEFSNTKSGFIAVYEESAKDGSEQNLVEIPVNFATEE